MSEPDSVDLRTTYLGLNLESPVVASAGPLTGDIAGARALAEAGAGAVVLPSLFEEEIVAEEVGLVRAMEAGSEHFAEALDYFPEVGEIPGVAERYVRTLEKIKAGVRVPVIASLNATSPGGWIRWALMIADAGADAIELNVYRVAVDPMTTSGQIEDADVALIREVCQATRLPVAVKLSPYYSAMAHFAGRVVAAGAAGLVLFNRFYQPDLDLEAMEVVPKVELSRPSELGLTLRWIAILRPQLQGSVSLAATSGVHSGPDAVKALAVGADVAMMTSALLSGGPSHMSLVIEELRAWMAIHEYSSVTELRASMAQLSAPAGEAFERANYMRTLRSWSSPLS